MKVAVQQQQHQEEQIIGWVVGVCANNGDTIDLHYLLVKVVIQWHCFQTFLVLDISIFMIVSVSTTLAVVVS